MSTRMHWIDIGKFDKLVERLAALDSQLDELEATATNSVDPDGLGVLDDIEEVIGEGFVACQRYMIERKGEATPGNPYACGPLHNGRFVAQILNAAGNYQKHHGEWPADQARWGNQQRNTAGVFRDAGVADSEYRLSKLLSQLSTPNQPRFGWLLPRLVAWREALDNSRAAATRRAGQNVASDRTSLQAKLAASSIRARLQRAGIFLTAWELLVAEIVDGVRGFYQLAPGVDDPRYQQDVLARHKSRLEGSLLWLVENGALSVAQADLVRECRVHRNEIAHELAKLLVDPSYDINVRLLGEMAAIIRAVGVFWGRIVVAVHHEFDGVAVSDDAIHSGPSLLMEHLLASCESMPS